MNASDHFKILKTICVPLMDASALSASSIPTVSRLLNELLEILRNIRSSGYSLNQSTIKYVFFPLYTLLNRNDSSAIPDQVLEKIFMVLQALCEDWWYYLELKDWEQLFMLCGSVIGSIGTKGKGKERADETKEAAVQCLLTLLRGRENDNGPLTPNQTRSRMNMFIEHAQTPSFIPILGQTLNSTLTSAECHSLPLQKATLDLLLIMLSVYFPGDLVVSVLPGVISTSCKLSLGAPGNKGWAKGTVVAKSLRVMQEVISRTIGDEPCIKAGAVVSVSNIEELTGLLSEQPPRQPPQKERQYGTTRTPSWLGQTSLQLLIAMKTLSSLVKHPTPSALNALCEFSAHVLLTTPTTLPQCQPLLLSYLLALSNAEFPSVSAKATDSLLDLLTTPSEARLSITRALMRITRDNLTALPVLLPSHVDSKVEHVAGIIEAICLLATRGDQNSLSSVASEIAKLLGPTGGVEKWGWSLLSVLELADPEVIVTRASAAQTMLENNPDASPWLPFPQPTLKNVSFTSTYESLVRMFHALGKAAGEAGLFAVEWFVSVGQSGKDSKAATGMWCACRLLEGISNVDLFQDPSTILKLSSRKKLEKLARALAKSTSQLWDGIGEDVLDVSSEDIPDNHQDPLESIQHVKGLVQLHDTLQISRGTPIGVRISSQPTLHRALSLQLLSLTAGILEARFAPLFIYTLYPILHSIVSPISFLSETALRALTFVTVCTSYASPANLLLSNFDYVLDSVSRRLNRQWLDVDATKVLTVMIRLVGADVVDRAGDVVEECFDRLDEYHGYEIVVEGLVEVLSEVMKVIRFEALSKQTDGTTLPIMQAQADQQKFDSFFEWFMHRHESPVDDDEDYGPAPRRAWGENDVQDKGKDKDNTEDEPESEAVLPDEEPPLDSSQALTKQVVQRSIYFLTHESVGIRARILDLLGSSVPVLSESSLMPSIHSAWPFILNRLADAEIIVVSAAAALVEALAAYMGSLMFRRIWDDVWPRFRTMLSKLELADKSNTINRRVRGGVGTESVYTHSHRLYRSIIKTMTAALRGVDPQDSSNWEVIVAFRRFLHSEAADELQQCARQLYVASGMVNADAVWLALTATSGQVASTSTKFLHEAQWNIVQNVSLILGELEPN
ncbi:armadillo-type protein [Rhodocollybia butyracea]|uniref:Armadillo-type protein n=1 Tax=Rhodocollybia butyracea TaxID=206335 RepID=A0A9P5UD55_9AGAR|nr:armadillo-type protein [Rhodocollybia butyracea]